MNSYIIERLEEALVHLTDASAEASDKNSIHTDDIELARQKIISVLLATKKEQLS